jgi:phospholipid-transporting ATPase
VPNLAKEGFEQFRRVANLYFLAVACLSLTPWSPVMYQTTWAPLLLVVGISMLKETLEDFKRHKQDMAQNNAPVDVVLAHGGGGGAWASTEWKALRPGDVVLVRRDEFFPADLLFLSSSHPEASCYVETKNLDGETNLTLKKAVEESRELVASSRTSTAGSW